MAERGEGVVEQPFGEHDTAHANKPVGTVQPATYRAACTLRRVELSHLSAKGAFDCGRAVVRASWPARRSPLGQIHTVDGHDADHHVVTYLDKTVGVDP
jgi:hypothetical protein